MGKATARDQAEGLRRLLGPRVPRLCNLTAAGRGAGRTTLAVNLAACLRRLGYEVLLIDANRSAGNVCDRLGLQSRFELAHALNGERALGEVLARGPEGIAVLPAGRGAAMLEGAQTGSDARAALAQLLGAADFVLVDAAPGSAGLARLPVAASAQEIVVTATHAQAITDSYAWLKALAGTRAGGWIGLALCGVRSEAAARQARANLHAVAARHLGLRLDDLGAVPHDSMVGLAARAARPVVHAFPQCPAARELRALAARLAPAPQAVAA